MLETRQPDPRIPIQSTAGTDSDAYLVEGDAAPPIGAYAVRFTLTSTSHFAGCRCCAPRAAAAVALAAMFRARATGLAPFFTRVVLHASPAGASAVRNALATDAVAAARFVMLDPVKV